MPAKQCQMEGESAGQRGDTVTEFPQIQGLRRWRLRGYKKAGV